MMKPVLKHPKYLKMNQKDKRWNKTCNANRDRANEEKISKDKEPEQFYKMMTSQWKRIFQHMHKTHKNKTKS
jgi:hypothetical protein